MTTYSSRTLSAATEKPVATGECIALVVSPAESFMVRKILTEPRKPVTHIISISANGVPVAFSNTGDLMTPLPKVPPHGVIEVVLSNQGKPAKMQIGVMGLVANASADETG